MAIDDNRLATEATEFRKKLDAMVVAASDVKKRYDAARARVLAPTTLLEEEHCAAAILAKEVHVAVALIELPLPTPSLGPTGSTAPSDDDYEAVVIANVHV
jgi:hypothetical protein